MAIKVTSRPLIIGATAAALACGIGGYVWKQEHREPLLEVYVFNLKSGSSIFIRTPDDKRILINGGANSEVIRELTDILPFYSRRIDMIVATDADGNDVSGLIDVLDRYTVDKVIVPAVTLRSLGLASSTDQIYQAFLDTVKRLKVPMQEVSAGDTLDFGQKIGGQSVKAEVLFPVAIETNHYSSTDSDTIASMSPSKPAFQYSKASAPEIIMRISYGNTSFMLLGNATTKVQKFLVSSASSSESVNKLPAHDLSADVLVVPHSALINSFSSELMDKMKPEYLIYSEAMTTSSKKSAASKDSISKDKKADPLYFILGDKRFNVKEKGTVKVTSDGMVLNVTDK